MAEERVLSPLYLKHFFTDRCSNYNPTSDTEGAQTPFWTLGFNPSMRTCRQKCVKSVINLPPPNAGV
jgi:hypothetical protein